ncbi:MULTISPECIES: hypothetical protein [Bacillus]|uniref:Uncharacterized protein n=1 Tax=Bacillus thuringiensis DB27 TaxID=1431339 RepID=W8ZB04_BACTU|nr:MULTISPECIES: hypothetical protein [Bacillus cereus group]KXY15053.1 hypothetical protein AT267_11500 [Bacillus cereus]MBG9634126.1 hypothetical protein [Bacillus thuringiensis]MBG9668776.1 hypothetical protein [Bacillus thuringiensis]MBH0355299.1 hypothetical protein [Bacillus thuringiensis]CDN39640.1 unnamed protein product [Bacillus thuringiensis DB27]
MKTWLKPVLCAGILAGGSMAINDMNVQASSYQMAASEEEGYHLSTAEAFKIENVDTESVVGKIMYRLAPADAVDAPAPIELPNAVAQTFVTNPDALANWEVKIFVKQDPSRPVVDAKAEFYNEAGELQGTTTFFYYV